MKGKVLYIGGFELPDKNAAAHRVIGNAKAFRDLGYEVKLVGLSKESVNIEPFHSSGFESYEESYPISNKDWLDYLIDISFVKKIILVEKPEIVILYNYPALKLFQLMNLCRKMDIKIFADITEWYVSEGNSIKSIVKKIDIAWRMKLLHFKLDGLIVISNYLKDYYKYKVKNIIVIPPLVDCEDHKWAIERDKSKSEDDIIRFVYSGSPGSGGKDRLDIVIENLEKVSKKLNKSITLDIIGIVLEDYLNNFNKKEFNYSFVTFHGRLNHKDAIKIVKDSNFTVFFRDNYIVNNAGFPTKFVESITLGTLVVTNATSDLPYYYEKFGEDLGVLIKDLSEITIEKGLFDALNFSKSQMNMRKEVGNNLKIFDYRNYIKQFNSFIKNTI